MFWLFYGYQLEFEGKPVFLEVRRNGFWAFRHMSGVLAHWGVGVSPTSCLAVITLEAALLWA